MQINTEFLSVFAQKEINRFKMKTGVFLFLVKDNNILLLRRYKTGIDDGNYVVPMGGVDANETLVSAIVREAYEEANIIIKPEDLSMCHLMHRLHPMPQNLSFQQIDVFFYAQNYTGTIENKEPHKCDELKFYPLDNLPENIAPFILYAIKAMQKQQIFSEFGWTK